MGMYKVDPLAPGTKSYKKAQREVSLKLWAMVGLDTIGRAAILLVSLGMVGLMVWAWVVYPPTGVTIIVAVFSTVAFVAGAIMLLGLVFPSYRERDYWRRARG